MEDERSDETVRVRATLRQRWPLFRGCHHAAYSKSRWRALDHVCLQHSTFEEEITLPVLVKIALYEKALLLSRGTPHSHYTVPKCGRESDGD